MFTNLREILALLRANRQLVEVSVPVDPRLELAEIHRRVIAAGGPALLFTRVQGSRFPVLTNLFGSRERVERVFGPRPLAFIHRVAELAEHLVPPTVGKLWSARDVGRGLLKVGTRRRRSGPVTEVVSRDLSLTALPLITSWSEDGGPFITLPLVYTQHPDDGRHNLGIYRMQRHGERRLGMHWQIGKGGGFHHHRAEQLGQALPATVFLGGPPALLAAALAPLPENVGELTLASLLLGSRLPLAKNPAGPHPLVAEAEFALIGTVPAGVRQAEGPFGDHYGYYSLAHDFPVFDLHAIAHRRDAIYPATVVGKPRQEDFYLGDFLQQLLSPLFPLVMPAVKNLWSYGETGYHALAAAEVRDRYPREAMMSAFRILGEGQLSLTKFLLVTDGAGDLQDFPALLRHLLARVVWQRDLFVFACVSMDTLDYTGPRLNEGSKGVLLGMGAPVRELPDAFSGDLPIGVTRAIPFTAGCLVLECVAHRAEPTAGQRLAAEPVFRDWPLLVLVDDARAATRSTARFLWTTFTRFEPAADLSAADRSIHRNQVRFTGPVAIDARWKASYPDELFCDPATAAQVTRRWREYFPGDVAMGDSDIAHLD